MGDSDIEMISTSVRSVTSDSDGVGSVVSRSPVPYRGPLRNIESIILLAISTPAGRIGFYMRQGFLGMLKYCIMFRSVRDILCKNFPSLGSLRSHFDLRAVFHKLPRLCTIQQVISSLEPANLTIRCEMSDQVPSDFLLALRDRMFERVTFILSDPETQFLEYRFKSNTLEIEHLSGTHSYLSSRSLLASVQCLQNLSIIRGHLDEAHCVYLKAHRLVNLTLDNVRFGFIVVDHLSRWITSHSHLRTLCLRYADLWSASSSACDLLRLVMCRLKLLTNLHVLELTIGGGLLPLGDLLCLTHLEVLSVNIELHSDTALWNHFRKVLKRLEGVEVRVTYFCTCSQRSDQLSVEAMGFSRKLAADVPGIRIYGPV